MFDDFDLQESYEDYAECDQWDDEIGFDPYEGCYTFDC